MKKRGRIDRKAVSQIITVILIVLIATTAVSIVYVLIKKQVQDTSLETEKKTYAIGNINLKVVDAYIQEGTPNNKLYIIVENTGQQEITSFVVKVTGTEDVYFNNSVYLPNKEKLGPLNARGIIIIPAPSPEDYGKYTKIEVWPKFEFETSSGEITEEIAETAKDEITFATSGGGGGSGAPSSPYGEIPVIRCGNRNLETGEECDDGNLVNGDGCSNECKIEIEYDEDFIFTFWPIFIEDSFSYDESLIDCMMDTGMNYASVAARPGYEVENSLNYLHNQKKYKIALEISPGYYGQDIEGFGTSLPELVYGDDDSKWLNAPCLDKEKCENWNSIHAYNPSYNGILWQNTLSNTHNVVLMINPDLVLYDNEMWGKPENIEWYFNSSIGDPNGDCKCNIISEGIGHENYIKAWTQKGSELYGIPKQVNPDSIVLFFGENPAKGLFYPRPWYSAGQQYFTKWGANDFLNGTGDYPSPEMYFLPNLEAIEKNILESNLSDAVPWFSYTGWFIDGVWKTDLEFDYSVSREAGRMLRNAGAKGFIIYPNAATCDNTYWLSHSKEMIEGFKEEPTYIEENKIRNNDFEAFEVIKPNPTDLLQLSPAFWSWSDTNPNYRDSAIYSNLTTDEQSGVYSWKHSRLEDIGSRTIYSDDFIIESKESGNYNLIVWTKSSINSANGKIKFYLSDEFIGEINFVNSWNKFEKEFNINSGIYKLKIIIQDNTGQKIDVFIDNISLIKT